MSIMWLILFCSLIKSIPEQKIRVSHAFLSALILVTVTSKAYWILLGVVVVDLHALLGLQSVQMPISVPNCKYRDYNSSKPTCCDMNYMSGFY